MEKKVTISEIAKETGVSKTTISRYLNGHYEYMSETTRKTIEAVISANRYVPNNAARSLKSKKSRLIGVVVNTLGYQVGAQTVTGIMNVCARNGYRTVLCHSDNDPEQEKQAIRHCIEQQVEGFVIIPSTDSVKLYLEICEEGIPVVLCSRVLEDWPYGAAYVGQQDLIEQMLAHLKEQGFEKVRFFCDVLDFNKKRRADIFARYAKREFSMKEKECIVLAGKEETEVAAAVADFIKAYPRHKKAIFAINTHVLFLVLKEFKRLNMAIPETMGVCGYDAIGWSELVTPGISSIHQPMYETGSAAARQLIECLQNNEMSSGKIELQGTLCFRDSTRLL